METQQLLSIAAILVLGVGAMWIAWRLRFPSILILLLFGFIAGPLTNIIHPDLLAGNLLFPLISLAVAIILFEGGLNLKFSELRHTAGAVRNLITVGVLLTWLIGTLAAYYVLKLDLELAVLLGAILVVTGPTVIMPLLRHLRPTGQINSVLKWEGVIVDPIGAILAVLVFQAILAGGLPEVASVVALNIIKTLGVATLLGAAGTLIIVFSLKRHWVPEYLHNATTLMLVVAAFAASNLLQQDSGLLTATVMGIALANQKMVSVKHIVEFKENLRVLIISSLFIVLSARLQISELTHVGLGSLVFLAILIVVARPAAVFFSTLRSKLSWRERLFVSCLAPRGVVAAAVSSVFAIRLTEQGYTQADLLVPVTFVVIIGTVSIYGLSAPRLARWLKVAEPNPQGVLMVGSHIWARQIAKILQQEGFKVLLVDDIWANVSAARMESLPVFYANMLSEYAFDELDLNGIGYMLAITSDSEFNSLVIVQFGNIIGRENCYQLASEDSSNQGKKTVSRYLRGRLLFTPDMTYRHLTRLFLAGASLKVTGLTSEFDYESYRENYGETSTPLFLIGEKGKLYLFGQDSHPKPQPGQRLVSLIVPALDRE